jgi:metallo-beta-lactamase class B
MKIFSVPLGLFLSVAVCAAQDTPDAHIAVAKAAAGQEYTSLFTTLCPAAPAATTAANPAGAPRGQRGQGQGGGAAAGGGGNAAQGQRRGPPAASTWHAEPVKVFDNLYFVGMTEYSAWAVVTSQGIIVIDTIYDYSIEDEVVGGLKKLGFDPANIKYAIVSHAHVDHSGGARYLQDHFGTRIVLSAADWDLFESNTAESARPKRDIVATDGYKLTLGDTTLTLHLTPGHTPGTISTIIPVKDQGRPHTVAEWGGTAFNFTPSAAGFQTYIDSAKKFSAIVTQAGADVIISNHTNYDGSKTKLPALATRKAGDAHPYVVGTESVKRYLKVAEECATSRLLGLK